MRIINRTKNTILAEKAIVADTLFKRMKGLLGRKDLPPGEALIINPCDSIHTFFMRFPIDAIFLDINNKIVGIKRALSPWRVTPVYWQAKLVIELGEGVITASSSSEGDEIVLI